MTTTPSGTPIAAEHIGYRVRCTACGRAGELDDFTAEGHVIVRHDAATWCVVKPPDVQPLELWWGRKP